MHDLPFPTEAAVALASGDEDEGLSGTAPNLVTLPVPSLAEEEATPVRSCAKSSSSSAPPIEKEDICDK